jgi:hypothetical protein
MAGPDVLRTEDVKKPKPAVDQVLISVRAVEATKADCEMRGLGQTLCDRQIAPEFRDRCHHFLFLADAEFAGRWEERPKDLIKNERRNRAG